MSKGSRCGSNLSFHNTRQVDAIPQCMLHPSTNHIFTRGKKMGEVSVETLDGCRLAYPSHSNAQAQRWFPSSLSNYVRVRALVSYTRGSEGVTINGSNAVALFYCKGGAERKRLIFRFPIYSSVIFTEISRRGMHAKEQLLLFRLLITVSLLETRLCHSRALRYEGH